MTIDDMIGFFGIDSKALAVEAAKQIAAEETEW
jgi:hypothetical protein